MALALLDTNAVSDLMRDQPQVKARAAAHADPLGTSVAATALDLNAIVISRDQFFQQVPGLQIEDWSV